MTASDAQSYSAPSAVEGWNSQTDGANSSGYPTAAPSGVNVGGAFSGAGGIVGGIQRGGAAGTLQAASGAARLGGAVTGNQGLNTAGSLGGNVLGIYSGLRSGGLPGYAGAALSGASAANNIAKLTTGSPLFSGPVASGLGAAGNALGIYSGLRQGGLAGYGGAALNAAGLYSNVAALAAANAGGGAAAGGAAAGAGAGAGSGLLAAAGPAAAFLGIAAMADAGLSSSPYTIAKVSPGQTVGTTPGGNQELQAGNLGYGAGQHQSAGAGNFFIKGANGQQTWLGQADSTVLKNAASLAGATGMMSQITYDPKAGAKDINNGALLPQQNSFGVQTGSVSPATLSTQLSAIYNAHGGQKAWGVPFAQWAQQASSLTQNVHYGH